MPSNRHSPGKNNTNKQKSRKHGLQVNTERTSFVKFREKTTEGGHSYSPQICKKILQI